MTVFCAMAAVAALMGHAPGEPMSVLTTDASSIPTVVVAQPVILDLTPMTIDADPNSLWTARHAEEFAFLEAASSPQPDPDADAIPVPTPGTAALAALAGLVLVLPRKRG